MPTVNVKLFFTRCIICSPVKEIDPLYKSCICVNLANLNQQHSPSLAISGLGLRPLQLPPDSRCVPRRRFMSVCSWLSNTD